MEKKPHLLTWPVSTRRLNTAASQRTKDWSSRTPISKGTVFVGYADSSWGNAQQCASQQGSIILITTAQCKEMNTKATVIDWKSNRSSRVCKSTLASEATACDDCVDRTYLPASF